ncbi:BT4734/BF3469 family protein [Chryseobacterium sp. 22532]|uniref:BT4734/BF3469 family protein n=1 Tax=Chryseobacterium sp. 22532 TaxID=3453938 RepID=UPI003F85935A
MEDIRFNIYEGFNKFNRYTNLDEIVHDIKIGTYQKVVISYIKKFAEEGKTEKTKKLKYKIPAFTISGKFSKYGRKTEYLITYHGWMVLDIDGIKDEETYQIIFNKVKDIPYTKVAFCSPSGKGMKIIVATNNRDVNRHSELYKKLVSYYEMKLNVKFDTSTCDVSRLCFYSYDQDIFYNKESEIFNFKAENSNGSENINQDDDVFILEMEEMIEFTEKKQKYEVGNRNNFIKLLSINCCNHGINKSQALEFCLGKFVEDDFDEHEIMITIENSYKKYDVNFGSWKNRLNKIVKQKLELQNTTKSEPEPPQLITKDISFKDEVFQQYYDDLCKTFPKKYTDFIGSLKTEREKEIVILTMMTVLNSIYQID